MAGESTLISRFLSVRLSLISSLFAAGTSATTSNSSGFSITSTSGSWLVFRIGTSSGFSGLILLGFRGVVGSGSSWSGDPNSMSCSFRGVLELKYSYLMMPLKFGPSKGMVKEFSRGASVSTAF